jgi:glyceraldehyde 3-phosphate dehydrogenase
MTKVAINGIDRIGIISARVVANRSDVKLVAINSTAEMRVLEYLLKHDSVHSVDLDIEAIDDTTIKVGEDIVEVCRDFREVDIVLDCIGDYKQKDCPVVVLADETAPTFVYGLNHRDYIGQKIISTATPTIDAVAVVTKVLDESFGVDSALVTAVQSYTIENNLLDGKSQKDLRRARAVGVNMLSTAIDSIDVIGDILPNLKGKLNGCAVVVPIASVSMIDLNVVLERNVTSDEVNEAFLAIKNCTLEVDFEKRVSSDFVGSGFCATIASDMTTVVNGNMLKVLAWYDSEYGYAQRIVDLALYIVRQQK